MENSNVFPEREIEKEKLVLTEAKEKEAKEKEAEAKEKEAKEKEKDKTKAITSKKSKRVRHTFSSYFLVLYSLTSILFQEGKKDAPAAAKVRMNFRIPK